MSVREINYKILTDLLSAADYDPMLVIRNLEAAHRHHAETSTIEENRAHHLQRADQFREMGHRYFAHFAIYDRPGQLAGKEVPSKSTGSP